MKNYKKTLFIAVIILLILLGYILLQKAPSKNMNTKPSASIAPINPTTMPRSLSDAVSAYTNIPALSFPDKLPIVTISSPRNLEAESSRIAAFFNINTSPRIISGSRGRYAITQNGISTLTLSENPLTFTYDIASISGSPISYDPTPLVDTSIKQLEDLSLLRAPISATEEVFSYFSPQGPSPNKLQNSTGATLVQVDLSFQVGKFPLFISDANTPTATTRFDGNKNLVQIRAYILPNMTVEKNEMTIVSYKEATERLAAGAGILSSVASVQNDGAFLTGLTPKNIEVSSVKLGYLLLSNRSDLVPVFIFSGTGYIEEDKKAVNTTTIISALP